MHSGNGRVCFIPVTEFIMAQTAPVGIEAWIIQVQVAVAQEHGRIPLRQAEVPLDRVGPRALAGRAG
jgi:hypothetical protein